MQTNNQFDELKHRLKAMWMTGDYGLFSRYMEKNAEEFFERLDVGPGTRLLDVGCGAGRIAVLAARKGAEVTGCDIATNWLEQARSRAAAEGLAISFDEGDAESLPYANHEFDVVVSMIGAMFAPRPELVARELVRVCRPGGTIAMANWTPGGFVGQMFKAVAQHIAPTDMPSPVLWGQEATVRDRLREGVAQLNLASRMYRFDYPFPPEKVVEFYRANYGPVACAFDSLDANGREKLRSELVRLWSTHNRGNGKSTQVDAEYLEVIATRAGSTPGMRQAGAARTQTGPAVRRAEALAARIEQGAEALAAFAEGLTETEWRAPMPGHAIDRRPMGVIVHHVASVYPIEVNLARTIASGKAVMDVTWALVAEMNAKHAQDHVEVGKDAALELLWRNSREAAAAVGALTDEELDRAAPFSLAHGAPVTAQFVIEDHALRHSWHHLARLRAALGR
jgi:SAM-dependent methyltransferase